MKLAWHYGGFPFLLSHAAERQGELDAWMAECFTQHRSLKCDAIFVRKPLSEWRDLQSADARVHFWFSRTMVIM